MTWSGRNCMTSGKVCLPFVGAVLTLAVLVAVLAGCSDSYIVVPVSGKVMRDGKPVAGAHVSFQPTAADPQSSINPGPGSYGVTDAAGRYQLKTVEPEYDGAVVGKHVVRISLTKSAESQSDVAGPEELLPAKFRDGSISFEVPQTGTESADFDLSGE